MYVVAHVGFDHTTIAIHSQSHNYAHTLSPALSLTLRDTLVLS